MMHHASKKTGKAQAAQKTGKFAFPGSKPDARLLDAEKFLLPTYKRPPIIMTHGQGAYVFDSQGKKYLDFLGGIAVNALGHAHPRIVKVIRREAARASLRRSAPSPVLRAKKPTASPATNAIVINTEVRLIGPPLHSYF